MPPRTTPNPLGRALMRLRSALLSPRAAEESVARCRGCRHFLDDPREIERRLAGLITLSSAYAAVRAADGLCSAHDRYVAASSRCPRWHERG